MNNFSTSNSVNHTEQSSSKFNHSRDNSKHFYDESRLFSDNNPKVNKNYRNPNFDFGLDKRLTNGILKFYIKLQVQNLQEKILKV